MRDTMTTSWRRLSDEARKYATTRSTRGEQSPPSTAPVSILIVDDDIKSSDSLERVLPTP